MFVQVGHRNGVVVTAMEPDFGVVPVIMTGLVVPKLKVGGGKSWEFAGAEVTAEERVTLPVNPLVGVTVIVETFPVSAPSTTFTVVPLMVNPGPTTAGFSAMLWACSVTMEQKVSVAKISEYHGARRFIANPFPEDLSGMRARK